MLKKIDVLYGNKSYSRDVDENRDFLLSIDKEMIKSFFMMHLTIPQMARVLRLFQDNCQRCKDKDTCTCYNRKVRENA